MKVINYSQHYTDKIDNISISKALNSGYLTKGSNLNNFESKIKKYVNSKYCLVLSNASSALLLALKALRLKKNDIVWCSNNTYVSSINCALHLGAKINVIDINLDNYNICVDDLKKRLSKCKKKQLPKYLIITHLGGYPCDLKIIYSLSKKYKFKIIEDASHALGSAYQNKRIGGCIYSVLTVFSFHPSKTITTGEGGAITTNNKKIYQSLKTLRENGHTFKKHVMNKVDLNFYDVKELGYNFRLNEISCALGISQLKKIKNFIDYKNKLAKNYFKKINKDKYFLPKYDFKDIKNSWHLFIVRINFEKIKKTKNQVIKYLLKNKINVKTHYPPLSSLTLIKKNLKKQRKLNKTNLYYKSALSIPLYYSLSLLDQNRIIKILNKI